MASNAINPASSRNIVISASSTQLFFSFVCFTEKNLRANKVAFFKFHSFYLESWMYKRILRETPKFHYELDSIVG